MDLAGKIKPWSRYLQPSREIDPGASRVNRLTLVNDKLCYNGIACKNVVPQEAGINIFFEHISKYYPDGVTLVAHNGFRFDFPLIKRDLRKYRFDENLGEQYQIIFHDNATPTGEHARCYNAPGMNELCVVASDIELGYPPLVIQHKYEKMKINLQN